MEIKNNVKTEIKNEERMVVSSDGIRMTYKEWLEMRQSEMY